LRLQSAERGALVELFGGILIAVALVAVLVLVVPRLMGGNTIVCTRCDGTGEVNERWPDPNESSGFHVAKGKCPKCKGRGRVRS
jgi:hypothetical protein